MPLWHIARKERAHTETAGAETRGEIARKAKQATLRPYLVEGHTMVTQDDESVKCPVDLVRDPIAREKKPDLKDEQGTSTSLVGRDIIISDRS